MNRDGKGEIDKVLTLARRAGFRVDPWGTKSWQITDHAGQQLRIPVSPRGKQVANAKAKLRRFGVPLNEQEFLTTMAVNPALEPPVTAPRPQPKPAPAPQPEPKAEPTPVITKPAPPPKPTPPPAPPRPKPDTDDERTGAAAIAHTMWQTIHALASEPTVLEGEPGLTWRGSFKAVFSATFPGLRADSRMAAWAYLRESGNMVCLQRERLNPSLWWLRQTWRDGATEPVANGVFVPVRTMRHPEPRVSAGPPAPVTVRYKDTPPQPQDTEDDMDTDDEPSAGEDLVTAVADLVARNRELEGQNVLLRAELVALRRRLTGT